MAQQSDFEQKFSILDYLDRLTPVDRKDRFFCPVCNGNNLTINRRTGAYKCWTGCTSKDIRESVAPIAEKLTNRQSSVLSKQKRPKQSRVWTYTDKNGNEIIRTVRHDDGEGGRKIFQEYFIDGKWLATLPSNASEEQVKAFEAKKGVLKKSVAPYRYTDLKKYIDRGEQIFWVEGEPCCDALWRLGIPATTSIGGSASYDRYGNYKELMAGANLVLCPDQDRAGVKYIEQVSLDFPGAKFLYAFPDSCLWDSLPKEKGLDIADWIEQGATKEQIFAAIVEKKKNLPVLDDAASSLTVEQVEKALEKLVVTPLTKVELTRKFYSLAERSPLTSREIESWYQEIRRSKEQELFPTDISELLKLQQTSLSAHDYFEAPLADRLEEIAEKIPTSTGWLVTTLLPALGASIGPKASVVIKASAGYSLSPIIWSFIVAKSGQKKTPVQQQIINPLATLEHHAYEVWKKDQERYKKEVAAKNRSRDDKGSEVQEPLPRNRYLTNDATPEGLLKLLSETKDGLLSYWDEFAKFFNGFNKYSQKRSGGDEEQFWLTLFNGGGTVWDRANTEKSGVVAKSNVCLTGSIQWNTLQQIHARHGFDDSSGMFARFLVCAEEAPPAYLNFEDEYDAPSDLPGFLERLYLDLRCMPERAYLLSPEAKKLFQAWQHGLVRKSIEEDHSGLALVYPKVETYTGRLALVLHLTNAAVLGKTPDPVISGETMQRAIKLAAYYLGQSRLIYGVNDPVTKEASIVYELVQKARTAGAPVSAHRLKTAIASLRDVGISEIVQYMKLAESQGQGVVQTKKGDNGHDEFFFTACASLSKIHRQILSAAGRTGFLTVGQCRNAVYAMRKNSKLYSEAKVASLFREIADAGFATLEEGERGLKLVVSELDADVVLESSSEVSKAKQIESPFTFSEPSDDLQYPEIDGIANSDRASESVASVVDRASENAYSYSGSIDSFLEDPEAESNDLASDDDFAYESRNRDYQQNGNGKAVQDLGLGEVSLERAGSVNPASESTKQNNDPNPDHDPNLPDWVQRDTLVEHVSGVRFRIANVKRGVESRAYKLCDGNGKKYLLKDCKPVDGSGQQS